MKQKIIIADIKSVNVEGKSEGHYFAVARNYLYIFHDEFEVKVAGGPIYRSKFDENVLFALPYDNKASNDVIALFRKLINGFHLIKNSGKDITIIFQSSAISATLLLLLFRSKARIFLIQYDEAIRNSLIKTLLFKMVKKKVSGIICPGDEIGKSLQKRYCIVPDYIYTSKKLPKRIRYEEKKFDFGMYGFISNGKGIYETASFLSNTPYTVKIAGEIAPLPEDREMYKKLLLLAEEKGNIDLEIGYLDDDTYENYLVNTKYVILNYTECYAYRSSGVALDAIYNGTPIITKDRAYVKFVKNYEVGCVYHDLKELNFSELMNPEKYKCYQDAIVNYLRTQQIEIQKIKEFVRDN